MKDTIRGLQNQFDQDEVHANTEKLNQRIAAVAPRRDPIQPHGERLM